VSFILLFAFYRADGSSVNPLDLYSLLLSFSVLTIVYNLSTYRLSGRFPSYILKYNTLVSAVGSAGFFRLASSKITLATLCYLHCN